METTETPDLAEIPTLPTLGEAKERQQALVNELNWLAGYVAALEGATNGKAHSSPT